MSEDRRQQNFAERLKRIEQQHTNEVEEPKPVQPSKPSNSFSYSVPKEDHRVRNTFIWVFILAAVGTGGYYGWKALPQDLTDALAALTSSDEEVDAADELTSALGIIETDTMSDQGPLFAISQVAQIADAPLDLAMVASGADVVTDKAELGTIFPLSTNAQCELRAVLADEKLVNIRVENALLPAPIQAFSDRELADLTLLNVQTVTMDGKAFDLDGRSAGQKNSLDVFLTDTSAPLYLVLQDMGPGIIWNLQAAPDVTVTHVAMISANSSGVVTPADNISVEALRVSDFALPLGLDDDDTERDCMVRPWRNPQPDWIGSRKAEEGDAKLTAEMASYAAGYAAYNRWYTQTLGVDAATNLITARDAAHVLIGPAPEAPLPYRPIAGQDVQLMQTDHVFTGDAATRAAQSQALHDSLFLAATGGKDGISGISAFEPPQNRDALGDTFATDAINDKRYVFMTETVTSDALLMTDEAVPNDAFMPLYAAVRAPARLAAYCADTLEAIASTCEVIHSDVRNTGDGNLELMGRLGFVPTSDLGDPATVENGKLFNTQVTLPYEGKFPPENEATNRIQMLTQAQEICDQLRVEFGNCVLTRVRFDVTELWITDLEILPADANPERVAATARFSVYADETVLDLQGFNDRVTELVNPSQ